MFLERKDAETQIRETNLSDVSDFVNHIFNVVA
jgi:hypothetical protein